MKFSALALSALALIAPGLSGAQERETFGDWVFLCDESQPCRILQQQTESATGELALRMIAAKTGENEAVLAAQMPMGVHLASGAVFRYQQSEAEDQRQMVWQRCLDQVCEAAITLGARDLELLAENDSLLFAYRVNPQDEPRVIRVSLNGFIEALEKTAQ